MKRRGNRKRLRGEEPDDTPEAVKWLRSKAWVVSEPTASYTVQRKRLVNEFFRRWPGFADTFNGFLKLEGGE